MRLVLLFSLVLSLSARAEERHLYMLPQPVQTSVELGPVAEGFHYASQIAWQGIKAGITYYLTGRPSAGIGILAFDLIKMAPDVSAQSLADLSVRYWWKNRAVLKQLARIPGAEKVYLIRGSTTEFRGLVAKRQFSRALVLIETTTRLPDEMTKWGRPIEIRNPETMRLNLRLLIGGEPARTIWTTTVKEVLEQRPLPKEIAGRWRADAHEAASESHWWERFMHRTPADSMKIEASIVGDDGAEHPIGAIYEGISVKRFLGMTLFRRLIPWEQALPVGERKCSRYITAIAR